MDCLGSQGLSSIKLKVETKPMVLIFRVIAPIALLWFGLAVQFPVKLKSPLRLHC